MDEQENQDEKKEFSEEIQEIHDLKSYLTTVDGISDQMKQEMSQHLDEISQLIPMLPGLVAKTVREGVDSKRKQIDADIKAKKQEIREAIKETKKEIESAVKEAQTSLNEKKGQIKSDIGEIDQTIQEDVMATAFTAAAASQRDSQWTDQKKSEGRNETVAETVQGVKSFSRDARASIAIGATKLVGFVGKGLALFGKKGLAQEMAKKVNEKSQNFVSRDSRVGKVAEGIAEGGYKAADGVRTGVDAVKTQAGIIKGTVSQKVSDTRDSISEGIETAKGAVKSAGRTVKQTAELGVDAAKRKATDVRDTVALGAMYAGDKVKSGAETVALGAMYVGGKIKSGAETVALGAMYAGKKIKSGAETVALGAMYAGDKAVRATVRGAAFTVALGKLSNEKIIQPAVKGVKSGMETATLGAMYVGDAVKSGAETVALGAMEVKDKAVQGVKSAKDTVALGAMYAGDAVRSGAETVALGAMYAGEKVAEKAGDVGEYSKASIEVAKKKVAQVKTAPLTLRDRVSKFAQFVSQKLSLSLEERQEIDMSREELAAAQQTQEQAKSKAFGRLGGKKKSNSGNEGR